MATMTLPMPAPSTAAMAIARISPGNEYRLSISMVNMRSKGPPTKPEISPSGTPRKNAAMAELSPTISAMRVPQMTRLSTSCPIWLVPRAKVRVLPLKSPTTLTPGKLGSTGSSSSMLATKPSILPSVRSVRPTSLVS